MDSITQIALGAAVGEAALGRRVGRVAAGWGAVLGTLPDLDIVLYPFLDGVGQLSVHRGLSHSLAFAALSAPAFGWMLARLHRGRGAPPRAWAWLSFWVILTHILIDGFTVYGTQMLQPFSPYPVSFDSIFIIDPLYTLPLLVGIVWAMVRRPASGAASRANWVGIALSTIYLAWTLVAKTVAHGAFTDGLEARGIVPDRVMTTPAPLTSLLWMGVADAGDTLWVSHTGLLDDGPPRDFIAVPRRAHLLAGHERDRGVHNLEWFSKGWWVAERGPDGSLFLNDLRFGRSDGYLEEDGDYVFRWRLVERDGRYVSHEQVQPEMRVSREVFARLVERIRYGPQ